MRWKYSESHPPTSPFFEETIDLADVELSGRDVEACWVFWGVLELPNPKEELPQMMVQDLGFRSLQIFVLQICGRFVGLLA